MVTTNKKIKINNKTYIVTIEKFIHNGYLCLSTLYNGYLEHKTYIGYNKTNAINDFISYLNSINGDVIKQN